jgi:hypothetical protein
VLQVCAVLVLSPHRVFVNDLEGQETSPPDPQHVCMAKVATA